METIKAWVYYGKMDLRFMDVRIDEPKANEMMIEVYRSGLCSSDVEEYFEGPLFKDKLPIIIGHEFGGRVVKVGEKVSKEWLGKTVTVLPLVSCGKCNYCLNSKENLCPNLGYYGLVRYDGGMAEYVDVDARNVVPVSKVNVLSFGEIVAVSLEAVEKVKERLGGELKDLNVLIVGGGIVGTITGLILRMNGARLSICENRGKRKKILEKLDFQIEEEINEFQDDRFDVIFDCAGHDVLLSPALPFELKKLKPGGIILLMGLYKTEIVDFRWDLLLRKEISIVPSIFYRKKSIRMIDYYLDAVSEYADELITVISPKDLKKYVEDYGLYKGKYMRIVVDRRKG